MPVPTPRLQCKVMGRAIQSATSEPLFHAYDSPFLTEVLAGERAHSVTQNDEAAPLASLYLNQRKIAIVGGSNGMRKNFIAIRVLGL